MIAEGGIAPKPGLNPKDAVQQRVISLRSLKIEPYTEKPVPGTQFWSGYKAVVIPDEPSLPGRLVYQEHGRNQSDEKYPVLQRERTSGRYRLCQTQLDTLAKI
jgi:hypothetical protein